MSMFMYRGPPTLPQQNVTVTLSAAPVLISAGQNSTLTWTSTNATSVSLDNGIGNVALNGNTTVSPSSTTNYNITANGFGGPVFASARVTVSNGTLTVTTTLIPFDSISGVMGDSKELDFARLRFPKTGGGFEYRWARVVGDMPVVASDPTLAVLPSSPESGNQEIISANLGAGLADWRLDQSWYIMDSTQIQFAFPDDNFCVAVAGATPADDEAWIFPGPTNHVPPGNAVITNRPVGASYTWFPLQAPGAAKQVLNVVMAWKPSTGVQRIVNPDVWPSGLPYRGFHDPLNGVVIVPGLTINGTVFYQYRVSDGADITPRYEPSGIYITDKNILGDVTVAGAAIDFPNRVFYVYDHQNATLWKVNLNFPTQGYNDSTVAVQVFPETPTTSHQGALKLAWEPNVRAVVYIGSHLVLYQPDTNNITVLNRTDGYLNAQGTFIGSGTLFYDPDQAALFAIGSVDFATPHTPSPGYWKLKIS